MSARTVTLVAVLASTFLATGMPNAQERTDTDTAMAAPRFRAEETRRWIAPEAKQGAAVGARYFYAITNSHIARYDKQTGEKLAEWVGDPTEIRHLNSCVVQSSELVCANSNFPQVPMASSVEVFDADTLLHKGSHGLGSLGGSLTWIERHDGIWWAGFANYDEHGGEPGRDHRFTQIMTFDDDWRRTGGYRLPDSVLERFAPMSNSGGSFGPDGLLYLTGHDEPEIYALAVPERGPVMKHVATIDAPLEGQAWAWDRSAARTIYGINRQGGEVIVMTVPTIVTGGSYPKR